MDSWGIFRWYHDGRKSGVSGFSDQEISHKSNIQRRPVFDTLSPNNGIKWLLYWVLVLFIKRNTVPWLFTFYLLVYLQRHRDGVNIGKTSVLVVIYSLVNTDSQRTRTTKRGTSEVILFSIDIFLRNLKPTKIYRTI